MESERIERQYKDSKDLFQYLMDKGEVSYATYIDSVYKKVLVLSAASFFEAIISKAISNFASKSSALDKRIVSLVELKVIDRQYHTLFDWNAKNTNAFWKLFGDDTKSTASQHIKEDSDLCNAEAAFIYLGSMRNSLVHQNFAEYDIDVNITVDEIYAKYQLACNFLDFVELVLTPGYIKSGLGKGTT